MQKRVFRTIGWVLAVLLAATLMFYASARAGSQAFPAEEAVEQALPLTAADSSLYSIAANNSAPAAPAAPVTIELCASAGSVSMPDSTVIPIWGFSGWNGSNCNPAQLPGPLLDVDVGDVVTVILHNQLAENVSISFPGHNVAPDFIGANPGGTTSYTFTASNPGTYLYESSILSETHLPMGLYGALVVRPDQNQAYGTDTTFDTEAILVLSELDPALNTDIDSGAYGTPGGLSMLDYAPRYWLINGEAYPEVNTISVTSGQRLLLRYLNAGSFQLTMTLLGMHQTLIARDANLQPFPFDIVAETIPSGATADSITTVPPAAVGDRFPLYNRQLHLNNGAAFPGGMMTFLEVTAVVPPPAPTPTPPPGPPPSPIYSVLVTPGIASQSGEVGTTVAFDFQVKNNGNTSDSYNVTLSGNNWTTNSPTTVGPLAPSGMANLSVSVAIPTGASNGDSDSVTITVTSQGDSSKLDTSILTTTAIVTPPPTPPPPPNQLYISLATGDATVVGSLTNVRDEDIIAFNGADFSMIFDGSDLSLDATDIDAFQIMDADTILISFDNPASVPGLGTVDDSDIVRFDATSFGSTTAGTFSSFFTGANVGLTNPNEDVDAIELLSDGRLLVSTSGNFNVPGLNGTNDDIIAFTPSTPGDYSSGTWTMYFDGSDVGLGPADIDALAVSAGGDIYLSTKDNLALPGLSVVEEDVFICTPGSLGSNTSCTYNPTLFFDGSVWGLAGNNVDAFELPGPDPLAATIVGLFAATNGPVWPENAVTLTAYVASGTNVVYTWDFGDGTSGKGVLVEHDYPGIGFYTARVSARNGVSQVTAQTEVQVGWQLFIPFVTQPTNQVACIPTTGQPKDSPPVCR